MIIKAWKLFEVTEDFEPRSLVHGHHDGTKITRNYNVDTWIHKSFDTPGFNVFSSYQDMVDYLPRFKKRKARLVGCQIHVSQLQSKTNSKYYLCENIFIPKANWDNRVAGSILLSGKIDYKALSVTMLKEYEKMTYAILSSSLF